MYIAKIAPHCLRFDWHSTAFACLRTLAKAGINIDIKSAIIAITTNNSTNVNPPFFFMISPFSPIPCRTASDRPLHRLNGNRIFFRPGFDDAVARRIPRDLFHDRYNCLWCQSFSGRQSAMPLAAESGKRMQNKCPRDV